MAANIAYLGGAVHSAAPPRLRPPPKPSTEPIFSKPPRRAAALLLLLSLPASSASGLSFGIPEPKEWLKEQKRKTAKFVLAPIGVSRQSLRNAYELLALDSDTPVDKSFIRKLLNLASRDCVPQDRSSIVAFQASTGVEVCTFRLILKNSSSLLDDRDPIKLEAEAKLGDLIRSFSNVGDAINNSDFQLAANRQKVKDGLMDTISALDSFEQGIKNCLGV